MLLFNYHVIKAQDSLQQKICILTKRKYRKEILQLISNGSNLLAMGL